MTADKISQETADRILDLVKDLCAAQRDSGRAVRDPARHARWLETQTTRDAAYGAVIDAVYGLVDWDAVVAAKVAARVAAAAAEDAPAQDGAR